MTWPAPDGRPAVKVTVAGVWVVSIVLLNPLPHRLLLTFPARLRLPWRYLLHTSSVINPVLCCSTLIYRSLNCCINLPTSAYGNNLLSIICQWRDALYYPIDSIHWHLNFQCIILCSLFHDLPLIIPRFSSLVIRDRRERTKVLKQTIYSVYRTAGFVEGVVEGKGFMVGAQTVKGAG